MGSIPRYSLESLFLRVKLSFLLFFTEKSYKGFKIVKILKKENMIKNALYWIRTCAASGHLVFRGHKGTVNF